MSETVDRLHAIFHGNVQGVGFRYTTKRIAASYPAITGVIRNLHDGTVELIIEGSKQNLESFLQDISKHLRLYISNIDINLSSHIKTYDKFDISL